MGIKGFFIMFLKVVNFKYFLVYLVLFVFCCVSVFLNSDKILFKCWVDGEYKDGAG